MQCLLPTLLALATSSCGGVLPTTAPPAAEVVPRSTEVVILPYEDFGPQSMSYEVLGFEWYQWHGHGDSDPTTTYDVRVVVHDGLSPQDLARRYPVLPERMQDYRYVSVDRARTLLRDNLPALRSLEADTPSVATTRKRLERTLQRLDEAFDTPRVPSSDGQ